MWTTISLGAGLAGTLTGLIGVLWLAKRLVTAHGHEREALIAKIDLTKRVDDLGRAVEDRDHALDALQTQLRGEQQARILAEKHRSELLATLAKVAPAHILVAGINDELRLLSNLSKAPAVPTAPSGGGASPLHGAPPKPPTT